MGRLRKQTAEYFPHFVAESRTKFVLESTWGNDGYAFWFKLLELLCRSDGHCYDCSQSADKTYLTALTKVADETANAMLDLLADMGKIDAELWRERKIIWCQTLVDNLAGMYAKRTTPIPQRPSLDGESALPPDPEDTPEPEAAPRKRRTSKRVDSQKSARGICDEVIELYNEICVSFPKVRSLSEARKKAIKARLASGYTAESFKELFQKAEASSFLKGKNDRNWQATFDWLIKDSNMAKVIDGNYADKGGGNYGPHTDRGRAGEDGTFPGGFKPSGGFRNGQK